LTAAGLAGAKGALPALARERALPRPPDPRRPWYWAAALLLHICIIALFLVTFRHQHEQEAQQSPPGVSVVFDNGGASQATAPPTPLKAPPAEQQAPPPAAPPPPPQEQAEVNLDMPQLPFATAPAPAPSTAPQHQAQKRQQVTRNTAPQRYVMMNNMSLGHPAPPTTFNHRAMNLDLTAADQQAVDGPQLTIKGDVGADWDAALNQWVEDHKYYPQAALEQNQQGSVKIRFKVDRAGNVTGVQLLNGSGSPFLDQAWSGLFQGVQLPPFPPGTKADNVTVDATMHYVLLH
jgi:protein TonB